MISQILREVKTAKALTVSSARREICDCLAKFGSVAEAEHHEVGPKQQEIDLKYPDAPQTADNIITAKVMIKRVAETNNLISLWELERYLPLT